ncbi:hypothetical protein HAZT_HAZT006548 [Hyalella azteca]|uniref:Sugar transporter SWEET n=1 Tax=Hyalella azteca TaxID=294128 RepID=A0A6A0H0W9_HYAAZ|nr:hypothetical protein HAZT_HAZT006548 [Hyalella azteca]
MLVFQDAVASLASSLTILLFLSGSFICLQIIRLGHTGSHSSFPFITGIFNSVTWLVYGSLLGDSSIIITNSVGLVTQVLYLMVFLLYCVAVPVRTAVKRQMLALVVILGSILYYATYSANDRLVVTSHVGLLSCIASILFCASPLASVFEVIRVKSTSIMPFPLILLMFLSTSAWTIYGRLIDAVFVVIPNFLCALISGLQLLLFLVYSPDTPESILKGIVFLY